jgi:putative peptide zinc metalloprotease protein
VEIVMASIATFIWWFSEPGFLNYLCLNIMFVSSVSTIMFNANPLMRYDGYYILSDILEIPNLRQKASTILNRKLGKLCLGLEEPDDPFLPHRHQTLFALYTVASAIYRWVVLLSILYFLNKVFEPYGLKILGQMIALASIYGMVVMPFWKIFKFFRVPGRLSKVKKVRMYATMAVIAMVVAGICFIPFPLSVLAEFELQPRDAESVYIEVEGTLKEVFVEPGQHVEKGQMLAKLSNVDLELEIERLRGERESNQAQLDNYKLLQFHDQSAGLQIEVLQQRLAALDDQLNKKLEDIKRLELKAPRAGTIIPPPYRPEQRGDTQIELAGWAGWPMEKRNIGATFTPDGTDNFFCQIGDPNLWDAVLVIDQRDMDLVRAGQQVRLMFNESAYHVFVSTLESLADDQMEQISPRLASTSGGAVPAQHDQSGAVKPLSTSYQAEVRLDNSLGLFRNGLTGTARIKSDPRTLASRFWRYVTRTFNFDL